MALCGPAAGSIRFVRAFHEDLRIILLRDQQTSSPTLGFHGAFRVTNRTKKGCLTLEFSGSFLARLYYIFAASYICGKRVNTFVWALDSADPPDGPAPGHVSTNIWWERGARYSAARARFAGECIKRCNKPHKNHIWWICGLWGAPSRSFNSMFQRRLSRTCYRSPGRILL